MTVTAERLRSRHPFELFLLMASAFAGVAGLINSSARPGTIRATVGPIGSTVWLLFLAIGAVAALIGIFWRDRATGLTLEEVGLLAAGAACSFYAVVALYVVGWSAFATAVWLVGFSAACFWRSLQLHRILTRVRKGRSGYIQGG